MNEALLKDLDTILNPPKLPEPKTEELDESDQASSILKHLALAAQVAGIDLEDDAQLKDFLVQVRTVVVKDTSKLKSTLRRWTAGKARSVVKTAKASVR